MKHFFEISLLIFLFIIFIFSLIIFIDRSIFSDVGFSSITTLGITSFTLVCTIALFLSRSIVTYPALFGSSTLGILLTYHSLSFFVVNFLFTFITYTIFELDYNIKSNCKYFKFNIITYRHFYHKDMLKNKKFLRLSLVISYFISTLLIVFPIPPLILSAFKNNTDLINFVSSEIKTYQQLFVFSAVPIVFSLLKND